MYSGIARSAGAWAKGTGSAPVSTSAQAMVLPPFSSYQLMLSGSVVGGPVAMSVSAATTNSPMRNSLRTIVRSLRDAQKPRRPHFRY